MCISDFNFQRRTRNTPEVGLEVIANVPRPSTRGTSCGGGLRFKLAKFEGIYNAYN
jgi:hypothetical protein